MDQCEASDESCPCCGLKNTTIDRVRNLLICLSCGGLAELGHLRAEAEFEELNTGRHVAVGTRLHAQQNVISGMKDTFAATRPSTEITLYNAKKVIESVARPLNLDREVDVAHNFYKIALQHSLTRGHKVQIMAAACLYISARLRTSHHMLLDFCDVVDANITLLTKYYMKLLLVLCISLPPVDPSIYIPRFVQKLKLPDQDKANVSRAALRICQRMKRDYMVVGRRACGLCGAAILLAARIYGYELPFKAIARIVKISESVLRNRIREFEETHAASLTIEAFLNTENGSKEEDETINVSDPPSFTKGAQYDKFLTEKLKDISQFKEFDEHVNNISIQIENTIKELERKASARVVRDTESLRKFRKDFDGYMSDDAEYVEAMQFLSPNHAKLLESVRDEDDKATNIVQQSNEAGSPVGHDGEEGNELDLEGIDDDEIDQYILGKDEARKKAKLWLKANVDWLKKQRLKKLEIEEDQAAAGLDPHHRKKRKRSTLPNKTDEKRLSMVKAKLSFLDELSSTLLVNKKDDEDHNDDDDEHSIAKIGRTEASQHAEEKDLFSANVSQSPRRMSPANVSQSPRRMSPANVSQSPRRMSSANVSQSPRRMSPANVSQSPRRMSPANVSQSPRRMSPANVSQSPRRMSPANVSQSPRRMSPANVSQSPRRMSPANVSQSSRRMSTQSDNESTNENLTESDQESNNSEDPFSFL